MSNKSEIINIETISQVHEGMGFEPPVHPLISVIDASKTSINKEMIGQKFSFNMFQISLKDKGCGFMYGRNKYDFDEGVLMLSSPKQIFTPLEEISEGEREGWMLMFHPDLIKGSELASQIHNHKFFSYDNHEALHLSKKEEDTLTEIVQKINDEVNGTMDDFSNKLIVSNITLLLEYISRYYNRQFITRKEQHKDTVTQFEKLLIEYFEGDNLIETGLPDGDYFAGKVFLSKHYLSDLLKKETGRSIKDHVNDYVVERAKETLLNSNDSVSSISYELGFNYPHYFTRLFKSKTGFTPQEYRTMSN